MTGNLILITGSNSGIGLAAAKSLAAEGHTVIGTVRSAEKGEHTIREVKEVAPDADISFMLLDLTDFNSIKSFADELLNTRLDGHYIDVLINNAGMLAPETRQICQRMDGVEATICSNALGPLILTELLLNHMKQSAEHSGEARIVFTNSSVTLATVVQSLFNQDDVFLRKEENYSSKQFVPYKTAKEVLMMGSLALTDELGPDSKLKINSLCPGAVSTSFMDNTSGFTTVIKSCLNWCCCCCTYLSCCGFQSVERGGDDIVALAVRKRGAGTGNFYVRGKLSAPSMLCQDKQNQQFVMAEVRKTLAGLQTAQK